MYCKTYVTNGSVVLACCDKDILGKNLVEGSYDVTIDESFYRGEETTEEQLAGLLQEADSINLFGKKTVGVALKQGFLTKNNIITIAGVEHAIIFRV